MKSGQYDNKININYYTSIRDLSQIIINMLKLSLIYCYVITWQVFDGVVVIVSFSLDVAFRFVVRMFCTV